MIMRGMFVYLPKTIQTALICSKVFDTDFQSLDWCLSKPAARQACGVLFCQSFENTFPTFGE